MELDSLFAQTLLGAHDDDEPCKAVRALQGIGSREVLDKAALWCKSDDPWERARGADVLAQLGKTAEHPDNNYPDESFAVLTELAASEQAKQPLESAIYALGHIRNPLALPLIIRYRASPDPDLRFAVAFACGQLGNETLAVETLLTLIRDDDSDVRDWAAFGLGTLSNTESPEIREALFSALSDSNEDVRGEALVGLARRKDIRVLPILLSRFEEDEIDDWTVEAASWMLDLENLAPEWEPSAFISELNKRFAKTE